MSEGEQIRDPSGYAVLYPSGRLSVWGFPTEESAREHMEENHGGLKPGGEIVAYTDIEDLK